MKIAGILISIIIACGMAGAADGVESQSEKEFINQLVQILATTQSPMARPQMRANLDQAIELWCRHFSGGKQKSKIVDGIIRSLLSNPFWLKNPMVPEGQPSNLDRAVENLVYYLFNDQSLQTAIHLLHLEKGLNNLVADIITALDGMYLKKGYKKNEIQYTDLEIERLKSIRSLAVSSRARRKEIQSVVGQNQLRYLLNQYYNVCQRILAPRRQIRL